MARPLVLIGACFAAALSAGISGAATFAAVMAAEGVPRGVGGLLSIMLVFGIILTLYAAVAAVVLGLPAHALLSRLRRTGVAAYALAGGASGLLVAGLFVPLGSSPHAGDLLSLLAPGAVAGAAGAAAFWLVARPDRRISPPPTSGS